MNYLPTEQKHLRKGRYHMKASRQDQMEQYILEHHSVALEDLCERFGISVSTARRDLDELVGRGRVEKVYGGVRAVELPTGGAPLLSYEERDIVNRAEKQYICKKAAAFVEDGDIIYIDTGTSSIGMIDYLGDISCTILTNSLAVASRAVVHENINIIMMPGRLNRKTKSFIDPEIGRYLRSLNIDKAFMATTGFSLKTGLTNASESEFIIKKAVVGASNQIWLLADHDKFERRALYTYCNFRDLDGLITDRRPDDEYVEYCESHGIRLIY